MTPLDRWIQRLRIAQARPHIPQGSRLLDIGSHDGALFRQLGHRLSAGIGIEPELKAPAAWDRFELRPGFFPDALDPEERFDVITLLAVLEHIPPDRQTPMAAALANHLAPGGALVITVPSPRVDSILAVLTALRLVHGMSVEQHYGFEPSKVEKLFSGSALTLEVRKTFQLGLNNLFVYRAPAARSGG